ncbi:MULTISPECIES: glycosyltransferase [unclassified Halomonas]|uniref:glycosyltransferase n=1 Tax=unclassified Halomonas TaxID=2609666 RepID=UPI0020766BD0|nr:MULTISPECIES: glycosyltransferase [unclassified Halomonas]
MSESGALSENRALSERFTLLVAGALDQRTGGYMYDARMVEALRSQGHLVEVAELGGQFPLACDRAAGEFAEALAKLDDGERVIIDGLVMGSLPDIVATHGARLDITALLHHPLGDEQGLNEETQARLHTSELEGLQSVTRIVVTSRFTARRLDELAQSYQLPLSAPIAVVEPGVEPAPVSPAPLNGEPIRLLCVATLTPRKGQDVLVEALAGLETRHFQCDLYGAPRDEAFAAEVAALIERHGLSQVTLHGECDAEALEAAYRGAHALVLPSWYEGYGMVVTEALAHGLPVITTTGGALADTLPDNAGLGVPPGDSLALGEAIERFLSDASLRARLYEGAREAREALDDWQAAGAAFTQALMRPAHFSAGSRFAADWLTLRESVDFGARSRELAQKADEWLGREPGEAVIADLGCGRGSNLQFLAPLIQGAHTWQLFDHDEQLLDEAKARAEALGSASNEPVSVEVHCASIADLDHPALASVRLVSASALLDLVSQEWIESLAERCADQRQAVLIALSVTGQWCFLDERGETLEDGDDLWARSLFNAHQARDKGLGSALGGAAQSALAQALEARGYRVEQADTPWRLEAGDSERRPLACSLIEGFAEAMTEQAPMEASRIAQWRDARLQGVRAGTLGVWVGHRDLLALPADKA